HLRVLASARSRALATDGRPGPQGPVRIDPCLATNTLARHGIGGGSELGADLQRHRAREVIDVAGPVDADVRIELAVAAEAVVRVRRVVLEVERVEQVQTRRHLEIAGDGELLAG